MLLVGVSALTVGLAVRNDSQPLAGLAIAGGFLAPILVGGSGGPVALFGYFAVLNGAIFALAWWKSWRALNVVGFVFTFVLGLVWGHEFYVPEHYAAVQPFLALFFVFYVAIPFLNLRRGSSPPKDPVDGLLVFGVPLVGFALQAALVQEWRYGAAWSALVLARVLRAALSAAAQARPAQVRAPLRRVPVARHHLRDDRDSFRPRQPLHGGTLGGGSRRRVLDGRAAEGRFARAFALLVLVGAGIAFAVSGVGGVDDPLFANAFFAGAMLIAASGLAIARVGDRAGAGLTAGERSLVAGGLWLGRRSGGSPRARIELVRQLPRAEEVHAVLAWVTAGVALALWGAALSPGRASRGPASSCCLRSPSLLPRFRPALERRSTRMAAIVWPCAWVVQWWALYAGRSVASASGDAAYAAIDPERRPERRACDRRRSP